MNFVCNGEHNSMKCFHMTWIVSFNAHSNSIIWFWIEFVKTLSKVIYYLYLTVASYFLSWQTCRRLTIIRQGTENAELVRRMMTPKPWMAPLSSQATTCLIKNGHFRLTSGSLPVQLPIKISFQDILIEPKFVHWQLRSFFVGNPHFFYLSHII